MWPPRRTTGSWAGTHGCCRRSWPTSPESEPVSGCIDVGCGPGALTAELVARLGAESVAAVDPSAPFVAAVRARYPGVDVHQASAERLPFPDGTFDAALAQLVVHFMADPVAGLAEMARVTRRDGVVAACVWDHAGEHGPLQHLLAGRPRARSRRRGRIAPRRCARGPPRGAVRRGRPARDRELRCSTLPSSIRASRPGGSRSPAASGRRVRSSPASTRIDRSHCASAVASCFPPAPFTLAARAWAARGVV